MDSMLAFARGQASRGNPLKVFDWDKAAQLIKDAKPNGAEAGLIEDWDWTGGTIYTADGIPDEDSYSGYLCSTWATPVLIMDGEEQDCYTSGDDPGWWPESARAILGGQVRGTTIDVEFEEIKGEIEA